MNKIIYRNLELNNSDLVSGNVVLQHATAGDTLAVDTLDFRVWTDTGGAEFDSDFILADGQDLTTSDSMTLRCLIHQSFSDFVPGETLTYYFGEMLISKFYIENVNRA